MRCNRFAIPVNIYPQKSNGLSIGCIFIVWRLLRIPSSYRRNSYSPFGCLRFLFGFESRNYHPHIVHCIWSFPWQNNQRKAIRTWWTNGDVGVSDGQFAINKAGIDNKIYEFPYQIPFFFRLSWKTWLSHAHSIFSDLWQGNTSDLSCHSNMFHSLHNRLPLILSGNPGSFLAIQAVQIVLKNKQVQEDLIPNADKYVSSMTDYQSLSLLVLVFFYKPAIW